MNVTEDSVFFAMSLKYKGTGYGIVQLFNTTQPTSYQVKHGLNSSNHLLPSTYQVQASFVFNSFTTEEQQNVTNTLQFTGLLDNT